MKVFLFLLTTSLLLHAADTTYDGTLKTDLIAKERQDKRAALMTERDHRHTDRLHIIKERDQKSKLERRAKRLKRHNHIAHSDLECHFKND